MVDPATTISPRERRRAWWRELGHVVCGPVMRACGAGVWTRERATRDVGRELCAASASTIGREQCVVGDQGVRLKRDCGRPKAAARLDAE